MERDRELAREFDKIADTWKWRPQFAVLLHSQSGATKTQIERSVRSLDRQIYPSWTLVDAPDGALGSALAAATGDYFFPLRAGDELAEAGLFRFAEALQSQGSP